MTGRTRRPVRWRHGHGGRVVPCGTSFARDQNRASCVAAAFSNPSQTPAIVGSADTNCGDCFGWQSTGSRTPSGSLGTDACSRLSRQDWLPTSSSRRWRSLRRPSSINVLKLVRKTSEKRRPGAAGKPCSKMPAALFAASILPSLSTASRPALTCCKYSPRSWNATQDISAMMFAEQSILDLGRRHGDERLGLSMPGHAIRRSVQYSG